MRTGNTLTLRFAMLLGNNFVILTTNLRFTSDTPLETSWFACFGLQAKLFDGTQFSLLFKIYSAEPHLDPWEMFVQFIMRSFTYHAVISRIEYTDHVFTQLMYKTLIGVSCNRKLPLISNSPYWWLVTLDLFNHSISNPVSTIQCPILDRGLFATKKVSPPHDTK